MSCDNATAPIDIKKNIECRCTEKCNYAFSYPIQSENIKITNFPYFISITPETMGSSTVTYNSNKYVVSDLRIYAPSLHTYNGEQADAELIIIHNIENGGGKLLVCVPIMSINNAGNTDSATYFDKIISVMTEYANQSGSTTTTTIPTFTIKNFIPLKPYYSYSGTFPYSSGSQTCDTTPYDYIVFSTIDKASLAMSDTSYAKLKTLIKQHPYSIVDSTTANNLCYNENGTASQTENMGSGYYFECNPSGSEGEITVPVYKESNKGITNIKFLNSIFSILIAIAVFYIIYRLASFIIGGSTKKKLYTGGAFKPSRMLSAFKSQNI